MSPGQPPPGLACRGAPLLPRGPSAPTSRYAAPGGSAALLRPRALTLRSPRSVWHGAGVTAGARSVLAGGASLPRPPALGQGPWDPSGDTGWGQQAGCAADAGSGGSLWSGVWSASRGAGGKRKGLDEVRRGSGSLAQGGWGRAWSRAGCARGVTAPDGGLLQVGSA